MQNVPLLQKNKPVCNMSQLAQLQPAGGGRSHGGSGGTRQEGREKGMDCRVGGRSREKREWREESRQAEEAAGENRSGHRRQTV